MLHNYFTIEAKSNSNKKEGHSKVRTGDEVTFIEPDSSSVVLTDSSSVQSSTKSSSTSSTGRQCVGAINSVSGSKRKFVLNAHRHAKCKLESACEFGVFNNLPATCSKQCTKKGA